MGWKVKKWIPYKASFWLALCWSCLFYSASASAVTTYQSSLTGSAAYLTRMELCEAAWAALSPSLKVYTGYCSTDQYPNGGGTAHACDYENAEPYLHGTHAPTENNCSKYDDQQNTRAWPQTNNGLWDPQQETRYNFTTITTCTTCTPTCPAGQVWNGTACVTNCPAGQQISSGYYDLGTDDNALPLTTSCDGGCEGSYTGSGVAYRSMVNGVYHYYSNGSYSKTGATCSGGTQSGTSIASLPPTTCNNETQDMGQVNGVTVCLNKSKETTKTSTTVTNGDGSTTTTETTTNPDGSTSTTITNKSADGNTISSTTTTTQRSGYCADNPDDPTCLADELAANDVPGFDEGLPEGVFPAMPSADPLDGLEVSYTRLGGVTGSCPAPIQFSAMGKDFEIAFDSLCQYAGMIEALLILMASFVGFRILIA